MHRFLEKWADRTPDALALVEHGGGTSYRELNGRANQFAHLLGDCGVARGDRVVLALDNGRDLVAAYFGTLKAGAVAVPLPAGPRSDRLRPAIDGCEPRVAVVDGSTARAAATDGPVARVPHVFVAQPSHRRNEVPLPFRDLTDAMAASPSHPVEATAGDDDLAAIIYTSGSTGEPRGVMLSHRNFVANAQSIVSYLGLTAADRVMCVLPFYYVYGLSLLHTHVVVGGSVVIENRSAFPNVVLQGMREYEVTGFAGVPSTFSLMLHRSSLAEADLPALRYVTQAGGAMPPARIAEWLDRGPRADFFVMYGATEAAARLTYLPPEDLRRKPGSIGRAIPGVEIQVITESGAVAGPDEVGELVARGANISSGYWRDAEETARRFSAHGYHTGDLGYRDAEGYFHLVGRRHDMIKVGANRVGVKEIEDVLNEHPAVHEAAVVGVAHDMLGEAPVAFVALREPLSDVENTLRAFGAARLAAYKVPVRVITIPELPKLPGAGKLDRASLRALAAEMRFEVAS